MKKTFYENVAKNVFINGIKEPYHTHLTHFDLADIEECLVKCRKLDNHGQHAAFLTFMRQRENKPKLTVFTTVGNTRNNNPFHVTSTGNVSRPITTQVTPKFTPINFGNFVRNTNNTSNTN